VVLRLVSAGNSGW